ncbi:MAG: chromosomal replication initiator protein DnaA [Clostridiales bacterium]|nr:chromosomal replication initiator protein DnaA [Clostridiales bacterium]
MQAGRRGTMNYTPEQRAMWDRAVENFRATLTAPAFDMWIKPLKLYAVTDSEILVVCDDPRTPIEIARHMMPRLSAMLQADFGRGHTLRLLDQRQLEEQANALKSTMLIERYTFENFIVGPSNNLAYAASLAVAEQPSDAYNPLFIYGDVGLGKTHLMNAIGNYILRQDPMARVLLTTSEHFTNELIEKIRNKRGDEMRNKMRSVDVLMVDDIQFLARTTVSQEEFFHTFNDLYLSGKQIVISSDRPPHELPTLEERLRSRFGSGLIVDIGKPDFETRVAIIRHKAEEDYIDLPSDAAQFIAAHFDRSIRELEGALTRVSAKSRLLGYPITLELTEEALRELVQTQDTRVVTPSAIIQTVAQQYDVRPEDILGKKRNQEVVVPRQISIYICRELTELSTVAIGREFGNRDHTTIMHSCEKVAGQMKGDAQFRRRVEELIDRVKGN